MNIGVVLWVVIHFFPIGWPQLDAVSEHGLAWARSQASESLLGIKSSDLTFLQQRFDRMRSHQTR